MKPIGLYVGTFSPPTLGHLSVVGKIQSSHSVRVGVALNSSKNPIFSLSENLAMMRQEVSTIGVDPLTVAPISGSVSRYAKLHEIHSVFRGSRGNVVDEAAEASLGYFYEQENPSLKVHVLLSDEKFMHASSSAAKELTYVGHDVRSVVSLAVKEALESRLIRQYPVAITGSMGAGKSKHAREMVDYARSQGIPITHIDFDTLAHEIYSSLPEPLYARVRESIRREFDIPDVAQGWIDSRILRKKLLEDPNDDKSLLNPEKLSRLNELLAYAMLFRYREKIIGVPGIILIDGAIVSDHGLSYLANNHVLIIDAPEEVRFERVMKRYKEKGDTVDESFVRSLFSRQTNVPEKVAIIEGDIEKAHHGDITHLENYQSKVDGRQDLFRALNVIDRFGDLRASLIFNFLKVSGNHDLMIAELRNLYNAKGRYYHNWGHITACLTELFDITISQNLSDDEIAIIGASILFHDIVYDTSDIGHYKINETMSAQFAGQYLGARGVNNLISAEIQRLIRETAHGQSPLGQDKLTKIMHDIDMSVLGLPESEYRIYGHDVRTELSPLVRGPAFEKARHDAFLVPTLEQESIYKTEYGQEKYEDQARKNLQAERDGEISFVPKDRV